MSELSVPNASRSARSPLRTCLREPIPEIYECAFYLDEAVCAHLAGRSVMAESLVRRADMPVIREWAESLWGPGSAKYRVIPEISPDLPKDQRIPVRMPTNAEKRELLKRDGYHCRFCGIPVITAEVRARIGTVYAPALPWGTSNETQHAAFQAMWLQYDHVLPHAKGGGNDLENVIITCAPCNFARMNSTLQEFGLIDPRTREPVRSSWDGLARFR